MSSPGSRRTPVDLALIVVHDGKPSELSYAELSERILDTARRLLAAGIRRGDCIALWAPNSAEWVITYFGAVRRRRDGRSDRPPEHADDRRGDLRARGARAVDYDGRTPQRAARARPRLPDAADRTRGHGRGGTLAGAGKRVAGTAGDRTDDVAALLYTSGTTGVPKAVPLTHRNLAANAAALRGQKLIVADDRVLLPLPLHHTYPFTVGLVTALLKGAAVVFPSGISGPEITGAARAGEATALLAVPRLCEALWDSVQAAVAQRGERAKKLFFRMLGLSIAVRRATGARLGKRLFRPVHERLGRGLDLIGCGGAKLDPELAWRLEGLGWTVLTGYGLTETSPVLTFNDRSHSRIGTEGRRTARRRARHSAGHHRARRRHDATDARPRRRRDRRAGSERVQRLPRQSRSNGRRVHRGWLLQDRRSRLDRPQGFPARRRPEQGAHRARRRQEGVPRSAREAVRRHRAAERGRHPRGRRPARRADRSRRARDPRARRDSAGDAAARGARGGRCPPAAASADQRVSRRALGVAAHAARQAAPSSLARALQAFGRGGFEGCRHRALCRGRALARDGARPGGVAMARRALPGQASSRSTRARSSICRSIRSNGSRSRPRSSSASASRLRARP